MQVARADKNDRKNFQSRVDEMQSVMLQKEKRIEQCESMQVFSLFLSFNNLLINCFQPPEEYLIALAIAALNQTRCIKMSCSHRLNLTYDPFIFLD